MAWWWPTLETHYHYVGYVFFDSLPFFNVVPLGCDSWWLASGGPLLQREARGDTVGSSLSTTSTTSSTWRGAALLLLALLAASSSEYLQLSELSVRKAVLSGHFEFSPGPSGLGALSYVLCVAL